MQLTPDAIPTNEQLRESLADRFYHPYKRQIWAGTALLLAAVVSFLAWREIRTTHRNEMWTRFGEAAHIFSLNVYEDPDLTAARKQIDALAALERDYPADEITPLILQARIEAQVGVGEYEAALKTLTDLRDRYRDFALNTLPADPDSAGRPRSLSQRLEDTIKREQSWAGKRTYVHHWPAEDRIALVETTRGSFWLSFYSEAREAPNHVESFIRHAKAGDYNGTQVYLAVQSVDGAAERFEAGSRESGVDKDGKEVVRDPSDHDKDDPADVIEPEDTRYTIRHQYRVVSSATMDSGESGSRFVVVAKKSGLEKLNGDRTPFAAVMDREKSLEVIEQIGRASTYATADATKDSEGVYRMRDHPYPAIYIRRVSVWAKEKLESGHAWDTSRVATDQVEAWEAGRIAPRPEDFTTPTKKEDPESPKKDPK